jgi:hypothetical protein
MTLSRPLLVAFTLLLGIMTAHEAEHAAQLAQKNALGASCPNDCRGLLGFAFDIEWVHFAYNFSIWLALGALLMLVGWRGSKLLAAAVAVQGYHVVEHVYKLAQWYANGGHSPTPGVLGRDFSLVELHFVINTVVFVLVVGAWVALRVPQSLWRLRTPRRVALAGGLVALSVIATGWGWSERPPTLKLAAGVHRGPLVVDRPMRVVGEPGAVVQGGIVVTADDVIVKGVEVRGGRNGIEVDGAERVLLEDVRVTGAREDGIHARRASIVVRRCEILSRGEWAHGIDISFAFDLPPSLVTGCTVRGGYEGIVTHFAKATLKRNRVSGTSLRAITMTEMSMGAIQRNVVRGVRGVGIFCGDYSHCTVTGNDVAHVRPDRTTGDRTRAGVAIQSHFGSKVVLGPNRVVWSPGGIMAFAEGSFALE